MSQTFNTMYAGFDVSTTAVKLGVTDGQGNFDVFETKMQGACHFLGQPAYNLMFLPEMFKTVIDAAKAKGWSFKNIKGVSYCVRQHDEVVLTPNGLLIPALSWQCKVAAAEVMRLREMGVENDVGKVEERFVLPKSMWLLSQRPDLVDSISHIVTLEAYIGFMLTGTLNYSMSEAASQGLVNQKTGKMSYETILKAGLRPEWFPEVVPSGSLIGFIDSGNCSDEWLEVAEELNGAAVFAGLGDNNSTGLGCGLKRYNRAIVSAGTSGPTVRRAKRDETFKGDAPRFDFYGDALILKMLDDCASWNDNFVKNFGKGNSFKAIDAMANDAAMSGGKLVKLNEMGKYPAEWETIPLPLQAASVQASIALRLLERAKIVLNEVTSEDAPRIDELTLTAGLSVSPYIKNVFSIGLQCLDPDIRMLIGSAPGKLVQHTATLGAVVNAMGEGNISKIFDLADELCPTQEFHIDPAVESKYYAFCADFFAEDLFCNERR